MQKSLTELWNDNHGNVLLAMFIGILIVGASILTYSHNRFVPVGFPDAKSIRKPNSAASRVAIENQFLIEIINAEDDSGSIMVAVFADAASFAGETDGGIRQILMVRDQTAAISIPLSELPSRFVISAFHDKDDNRVLNTNAIGIPTERYGFSREARGRTGPPNYADAVIDRPESAQLITIRLE